MHDRPRTGECNAPVRKLLLLGSDVLLLTIASTAGPRMPAPAIRSCQVGLHGLHIRTPAPAAQLHASRVRRRSQGSLPQCFRCRFWCGQRRSPLLPFAPAGGRPLGRRLAALGGCGAGERQQQAGKGMERSRHLQI